MNNWINLLPMAVLLLSISVAFIIVRQNDLRHQIWCMKWRDRRVQGTTTIDDYVDTSQIILGLNKELEDVKQQLKETEESNAKLTERVKFLESKLEKAKEDNIC